MEGSERFLLVVLQILTNAKLEVSRRDKIIEMFQ